jgi:hypothetical protein
MPHSTHWKSCSHSAAQEIIWLYGTRNAIHLFTEPRAHWKHFATLNTASARQIILPFPYLNLRPHRVVSHWLPTAAARVRAQARSCGICAGQSGTAVGFLRVLRFPLPIRIPPIAPQSSSSVIWGWYNRPNSGSSTKWTQSHPMRIIIIIIIIIINTSTFCKWSYPLGSQTNVHFKIIQIKASFKFHRL